jgi:ribosomal protein L16 Arg81 hydroxylase
MFNVGNKLQADQFNVQTSQQAGQFNAAQVNAMTQATAQLNAQREQFNAQMSSQIEQSNVNWRRQVNQQNTAGINAVNQANVQNAFNLSNQALTFLWQEMRDKAHWEFQASESEKDRKNQLEATLLANETAMGGEIGRTLENLINGGKFLTSFLDNWKR